MNEDNAPKLRIKPPTPMNEDNAPKLRKSSLPSPSPRPCDPPKDTSDQLSVKGRIRRIDADVERIYSDFEKACADLPEEFAGICLLKLSAKMQEGAGNHEISEELQQMVDVLVGQELTKELAADQGE